MNNLYFSPKGRLGPSAFMRAAILLIIINFVFAVLPLLSATFYFLAAPVGLLLFWALFCTWARRLHDAGKSAWMFLLVLLVYIIIGSLTTKLIYMLTGFDPVAAQAAAAAKGTDFMAIMKASVGTTRPIALPIAITGAVTSYIIFFVGNRVLKSDPEENQYGPATS